MRYFISYQITTVNGNTCRNTIIERFSPICDEDSISDVEQEIAENVGTTEAAITVLNFIKLD